jgi:hypothetical protein
VFVGTKRSAVTTIEEKALLRHSGYPGYVAEDAWGNPSHPGIKPLVSGMSLKYDPDIVLLSIGTNDCGLMSGNGYTKQEMDEQLVRYENLIKEIEAFMDDNDVLFCDTITPGANLFINSIKEDHSIGIKSIIERLSDRGYKMAVGDTRSTLTAAGINNIISTDGVHLSVYGSSVLADSWYDIITAAYNKNSVKILKHTPVSPKAVTNLKASAEAVQAKLSWSKVEDADGYRVYKYDSSSGTYKSVKTGISCLPSDGGRILSNFL